MLLQKERELMRQHVKNVGLIRILLTYLLILVVIIAVESLASYKIHLIKDVVHSAAILRDVFSIIAVMVVTFTIISNTVFIGGRKKADREFHYYFRTRPLLFFSGVAVFGDIIAISVAHNTGPGYIMFYASLISLNVFAIGLAIHSAEKAISKGI